MTYDYKNVAEAMETLAQYSRTMHAYGHAMNAIYLDTGTVAPQGHHCRTQCHHVRPQRCDL